MKKLLSILLCLGALRSIAQDSIYRKYEIEIMSAENDFFILTNHENKIDNIEEKTHKSRVKSIKDNSAFTKPKTLEEIEKSLEIENLLYFRFKDNRGRLNIDTYINKEIDTSEHNQMWTKSMCYLNNDSTIEIVTGNGIFSSQSINIKIDKNLYYSTFNLDVGEQKILKRDYSDSLLTNIINLENNVSFFKLNEKPTFIEGESIIGSLFFSTENFLRDLEYDELIYRDKYEGERFNDIYISGTILFTCKTKSSEKFNRIALD